MGPLSLGHRPIQKQSLKIEEKLIRKNLNTNRAAFTIIAIPIKKNIPLILTIDFKMKEVEDEVGLTYCQKSVICVDFQKPH